MSRVMNGDRKVVYAGVFLDDEEHGKLVQWWNETVGPTLDTIHAHHLTLKFKPSQEEVDALPLGDVTELRVTGYVRNDDVQAVLIELPAGVVCSNEHPHITLSTAEGIKPFASNAALKEGPIVEIGGPVLCGLADTFPR